MQKNKKNKVLQKKNAMCIFSAFLCSTFVLSKEKLAS